MKYFDRRLRRLTGLGFLLQFSPFVQAVILTGSMTTGSDNIKSDIDLLIITSPKRLFIARFFVTLLTALTGHRRKPIDKNPAGKFCLNYYLPSDNLDIKPHTNECAKYHRYMVRIWDRGGELERIYRENFWLYNYTVEIIDAMKVNKLKTVFPMERSVFLSTIRRFFELFFYGKFGDWFEKKMFNWQKRKITSTKLYKLNKKTIIVFKNELRLHPKKHLLL